jgi:hypothetical protein
MEENQQVEQIKEDYLLEPLNSADDISNWFITYFNLEFPKTIVHPESTHSPIDAAWRIYQLIRDGESAEIPEIVMLSSRDSYKTLLAAALEVLCMIHFRISVAHLAAIKPQSAKAVQYVNSFFRKIGPYLEAKGWVKNSDNKEKIEWITDEGEDVYLRVLVATLAGVNSEHVPLLFVDEVDVIQDPKVLEEVKGVPTTYKGYFPLTVFLSTRKFAGGLMEKTLKEVKASGGEILRWNILDISNRIPHEEALVDEPKVLRYISSELPMGNLSPGQYESLTHEDKKKYEPFDAYAGIASHPFLSVMRNYLVDRPQEDDGGLHKPMVSVYNLFRKTNPDWANAQLLCNKPSSFGLVYPRFNSVGNTMNPADAYEHLTGNRRDDVTIEYLVDFMHQLGIEFFAGVDWGFTDEGTIVVGALIPNGDVWVMDMMSEAELELDDMIANAQKLDELYRVKRWYCDSNYPANIKAFNNKKNGLSGRARGVKKTKDFVNDSITSVQGAIVDNSQYRKLKIIKHKSTERIVECFGVYRWKTDGKGDPIDGVPEHGKDGTADVMDGVRYLVWGTLGKIGGVTYTSAGAKKGKDDQENWQEKVRQHNSNMISNRISQITGSNSSNSSKSKKKGGITFSF